MPIRPCLPAVAVLVLAALVLVPSAARAETTTVVPTATVDRTFAGSQGGWTATAQLTGGACVSVLIPCTTAAWIPTNGTDGLFDGFLRAEIGGAVQAGADATIDWNSPAFTAPAAGTDSGTLRFKLRPSIANLLAVPGNSATLEPALVRAGGAQTILLSGPTSPPASTQWTTLTFQVPNGQLVAGATYTLRLRTELDATTNTLAATTVDYDDVSLSLVHLDVPTGLSASADTTTAPPQITGAVNPSGLSTRVRVAYGTSPSALTSAAGPVTVGPSSSPEPYAVPLGGLSPSTVFYYRVTATNADGSATSSVQSFTSPALPVAGPPVVTGALAQSARTVTFDTTGATSAAVRVTAPDSTITTISNNPLTGSQAISLAGADGVYQVQIVRTNGSGSTTSAPTAAVLDTTPPAITAPAITARVPLGNTRPRIVDVALPGDVVTASAQVVTALGANVGSPVDVSTGSGVVTLGTQDNTYGVRVTATDAAGNSASATGAFMVLDTIAPATVGANLTATPALSASRARTVGVTVPGDAVSAGIQVVDGTGTPVGASVPVSGSGTPVELGTTDGTYRAVVTFVDGAGNQSSLSSGVLTLDTTPPATGAVNLTLSPSTSGVVNRTLTFTPPGDAVAASAVVLTAAGAAFGPPVDVTGGSGAMTLDNVTGDYRARLTVTDAAGNSASVTSTPVTLTGPAVSPLSLSGAADALAVQFALDPTSTTAWLDVRDAGGVLVTRIPLPLTASNVTLRLPSDAGRYDLQVGQSNATGVESLSTTLSATRVDATPATGPGTPPASGGGSPGGGGAAADPGGLGPTLTACYASTLALADAAVSGRRVRVSGLGSTAAGTNVAILDGRGRQVATAVTGTDGRFAAAFGAPRKSQRARARYTAAVGAARSPALRLAQANRVASATVAGATVSLRGTLAPAARRGKTLSLQVRGARGAAGCGAAAPTLRAVGKPRYSARTGRYRLRARVPAGSGPLVLRVRAKGRGTTFSTYVIR